MYEVDAVDEYLTVEPDCRQVLDIFDESGARLSIGLIRKATVQLVRLLACYGVVVVVVVVVDFTLILRCDSVKELVIFARSSPTVTVRPS